MSNGDEARCDLSPASLPAAQNWQHPAPHPFAPAPAPALPRPLPTSSTLLFSTLQSRLPRLRAASNATRAMRSTSGSLVRSGTGGHSQVREDGQAKAR